MKKNNGGQNAMNGQPAVNMISEGTHIKGDITTQNDFRISGTVEGELDVKGKCIITQTGKVLGKINAQDADISGKVEGTVVTSNKLTLRQTAHVTGDVETKVILVEEGARFDGACRMSQKPGAAASQNGKVTLEKATK
ncbi:MAG: polymer-forming cytoskeletal protein [Balneolia bacterium]|nr:polymer-forming cytoskeletal protein [Balneolia bacterium]